MAEVTLNVTCTLCGVSHSSLVQAGVRHGPEFGVRRCDECGLVFLFPQPGEEDLKQYYSDAYRDEYAEPPVQDRYRTDLDEARVRVRRLLPLLSPETRLLEVGSGSGAFLDAVRPYVKHAVGVEPDRTARAWMQEVLGVNVVGELPAPDEATVYDLLVLFHVLEHVRNPPDYLIGLRRFLHRNSTLVIEVPNVEDALVSLYDIPSYRSFYFQKAHLYYFSLHTLASTLAKAGYSQRIIGIQRYDLSNHIRWMLTGQPGGQGYYNHILAPSANAAYADSLIGSSHADTLWAVARRME